MKICRGLVYRRKNFSNQFSLHEVKIRCESFFVTTESLSTESSQGSFSLCVVAFCRIHVYSKPQKNHFPTLVQSRNESVKKFFIGDYLEW